MMAMFRIVSLGMTFNHSLEAARRTGNVGNEYIIAFHELGSAGIPCPPDWRRPPGQAPGHDVGHRLRREHGNRRASCEGNGYDQLLQWRAGPILYRNYNSPGP